MSKARLDPAVAELVESRRLGSLEQSRHRFTVSREEALLRLREQIRARSESRWVWTLALVRAANTLSDHAEARISVEELEGDTGPQRITTLDVITPGIELDALDLSDLLAGALAPDIGLPPSEREPSQRFARFRMLIGRALNGALAHEPLSVEFETIAGGRRFDRREQNVEERDPYVERKIAGCAHASRFVLRLREARPGLSSRLGRWLRGRGAVDEELLGLWRDHQVREPDGDEAEAPEDEQDSVTLGLALRRPRVELGRVAHLWPGPVGDTPSLWLIRDGLHLLDLGPALVDQHIEVAAVAGFVDCPALRLTADERGVVRDARFDQLVAWLHDYRDQVATHPDEGEAASAPSFGPRSLSAGVQAANGRAITVDELAESAHRGRELVYVWRHQASTVPGWAKSRTAALWPTEELQLREHLGELRLVPLRALGQTDVDPADLTSLQAGCFEPIALVNDCPLELDERPSEFGALEVSVEAFIHRAPTASQGFIVILAYERRVAQVYERAQVFPGVTLIARVSNPGPASTLDVAALRKDSATVAAIAELCREQTRDHWEALLTHVMRRANAWENPLLRNRLLELRAQTIGLGYRQTDAGLRLSWTDTVLLDVEIGRVNEGESEGERKTLRDALRNVRERGFVLIAHPHKRHSTLRSADPLLQPWRLDDDNTRAVLTRLIGHAAILDMPVVAEAHPLVVDEPVVDQRHLLRERATIERERGRCATDPLARQRLIGHLLVARGLDKSAMGLETLPLFERYDPRAQHPTRLVSLDAAISERPRPGLVPVGAVDRELPRPMLEVTAGVAALLAEVAELEPGETSGTQAELIIDEPSQPTERSTSTPVRRRGRASAPMLVRTVAGPLALGRLQVAADASSTGIGLWAGGLRVGELQLPEPLGRVSGRLVLTAQGRRVGASAIQELATKEARALIAEAPRQRTLLPPGGEQRERLDHFVGYLRSILAVDDRFELGPALGLDQARAHGDRVVALREASLLAAPLRPLRQRDALLAEVVRQSLAMRVSFDTAMLSWRPARLRRRRSDDTFELEFGLRNSWIRRALDEDRKLDADAHRRSALFAGLFVVVAFYEQARERDDTDIGPEHLFVALWRLLSLSMKS